MDTEAATCGGTLDDNNTYGEGRLDAYAAVTAAPRGDAGRLTGVVTDAATGAPVAGATVRVAETTVTTSDTGAYTVVVPAGSHEVTVSRLGYAGVTAEVTVPAGGTATRDFALAPVTASTVTGRVTDGSGHGWSLYARVRVASRPDIFTFTDPVTGRFSLTVPGGSGVELTVSPVYPGYRTVTVPVPAGGEPVDVAVPVAQACTAPGYAPAFRAPVLTESFDGGTAPAGWSVVNRTPSGGWQFDDPGGRGNLTGGTGGFAIIDSDDLGSGNTQDSDLVTPPLDLSASADPYVRFNSDWRAVGTTNIADVDVSRDGGTTWANVWSHNASRRGPVVEEVRLTGLAGATDARVRFRFRGTWAWWWQVDNVRVGDRACDPVAGGLVVGTTTDRTTGTPRNGVTVTSVERPTDRAVSGPTPDDPAEPDGFYWFFSHLTGDREVTAARPPYQSVTRTVAIPADGVVRADFALPSGRIEVSPSTIQTHQPFGSTRRTTLRVTNTGTAPANVELLERTGSFALLGRTGPAPIIRAVPGGLSAARTGARGPAGAAGTAATTAVDPAWTRIANHPTAVYDNAAATLDGKVYSVGSGVVGTEDQAWVYDPAVNEWTALPDMPTARTKPSAAALGGKLYVLGGWGANAMPVATVDVFDPVTGAWQTLPGVTNPAPRAAAGTAVAAGKIVLVGGCVDGDCTESAGTSLFDPATRTFTAGAAYPHAVAWGSCGGVGNRVYCAGGRAGETAYRDAAVYDPATAAWTALPDMPLDLWASHYSAASGLFVISGGATANSTAVTNRTIAYDPTAGAWQELPNAQFARYRGAGACGFYKIGGAPASFTGTTDSERLGGLDQCDAEADVPWLAATPTAFTLAAGASRTVTVTLTADVDQPGAYSAQLAVRADVPAAVAPVTVTMNVAPPAGWGKLLGTVSGRACGGSTPGVPATVRVNALATPGAGFTLRADAQGRYAYWIPAGQYEVIAAKDGWVPVAQRIRVQAGFVQPLDFALPPVNPCP
ncbi:MAG TPA: carboxypeptidase regulatory-like domain-containing protein [Pilimelia sp.]|nr:carboxypeptidase regulatory-like domain-containing protein [Pilimelia sp.]